MCSNVLIWSLPFPFVSPLLSASLHWTDLPAFSRLRNGQFQWMQAQLCGGVRWWQVCLSLLFLINHTKAQSGHGYSFISGSLSCDSLLILCLNILLCHDKKWMVLSRYIVVTLPNCVHVRLALVRITYWVTDKKYDFCHEEKFHCNFLLFFF